MSDNELKNFGIPLYLNQNNMKSPQKPSIGRIVVYVPEEISVESSNGAKEVPAIIARTWEDTGYQNDECNLRVLCDGREVTWQTSVPYSEGGEPRTWHWPAKV